MQRAFPFAIPLVFVASTAAPSVLTFEGGTYYWAGEFGSELHYTEGDFVVTPDNGWAVEDGNLHSHSAFTNTVTLVDGGKFNAESVDLDPAVSAYRFWDSSTGDITMCDTLCMDVSITGYRDGVAVANLVASSVEDVGVFDSSFNGIDAIEISWRNFFGDDDILALESQGIYLEYDDAFLNYDNLAIAAVPLPASAFLLVAGLLGIGAVARRRA